MSFCVCVLLEMKLEMIYLCQEEHTGKVTGNGYIWIGWLLGWLDNGCL